MSSQEEQILVIPARELEAIAPFVGFTSDVDAYLDKVLGSTHLEFRPRGEMEVDPSFKQLIPYVILRHVGQDGVPHIFAYTRGNGQGESRLHTRRSIGIGGHISTEDAAPQANGTDMGPYRNGMLRELAEEVHLDSVYQERCVGMIYDPTSEVGRVHLGVVHLFDVAEPAVTPNEEDICNAGFVAIESLYADWECLETWSQLCLESLFPKP